MRKALVLYKDEVAGTLSQIENGDFLFEYTDNWILSDKPSISLTLPKHEKVFKSTMLFPFFFNMLPEGTNKEIVCFEMRIEPDDYFGLLLNTAQNDTIGAVTVKEIV